MERKQDLEVFLRFVVDECTDQYGNIQILTTDDEQTKKDYYSQTVEGTVERFIRTRPIETDDNVALTAVELSTGLSSGSKLIRKYVEDAKKLVVKRKNK